MSYGRCPDARLEGASLSRRSLGRPALHQSNAPYRRGVDQGVCPPVRSSAFPSRRRYRQKHIVCGSGGERLAHGFDHYEAHGRKRAAARGRDNRRRRRTRLAEANAARRHVAGGKRSDGDHTFPVAAGSRNSQGAKSDTQSKERDRSGAHGQIDCTSPSQAMRLPAKRHIGRVYVARRNDLVTRAMRLEIGRDRPLSVDGRQVFALRRIHRHRFYNRRKTAAHQGARQGGKAVAQGI